jgi:hypothetical protein
MLPKGIKKNYVNINELLFTCRQTYAMGDRLTLEQRRVVASLMECMVLHDMKFLVRHYLCICLKRTQKITKSSQSGCAG